jgi:hypothetical protein
LNHERKISGDRGLDSQGQGHDWKGHGPATLRGRSGDDGSEDHGHGEQIPVGEEGEKVVFDGKTPPVDKKVSVQFVFHLEQSLSKIFGKSLG